MTEGDAATEAPDGDVGADQGSLEQHPGRGDAEWEAEPQGPGSQLSKALEFGGWMVGDEVNFTFDAEAVGAVPAAAR